MSIIPLLTTLARELDSEYRSLNEWDHLLDDDFGFGLHPMELFHRPRSVILHPKRRFVPYDRGHNYHQQLLQKRASRLRGEQLPSLLSTVGKDGFQVCMDVSQFKPNELTVKVVDKTVVVEGRHEEREDDHGLIERHFVRKYTLPKDYDPNEVVSTISSDGVLTLKAPPPPNKALSQRERIVQIQQTGPAHLSVKAPEGASAAENGANEKIETAK